MVAALPGPAGRTMVLHRVLKAAGIQEALSNIRPPPSRATLKPPLPEESGSMAQLTAVHSEAVAQDLPAARADAGADEAQWNSYSTSNKSTGLPPHNKDRLDEQRI